jgi:hypothetical protein
VGEERRRFHDTMAVAAANNANWSRRISLYLSGIRATLLIAGVGLHPVAVIVGALAEHFLAHHRDVQDVTDKMDHLFRPGETAEIAVDDDAIEAVVYKIEQITEEAGEEFRGKLLYTGGRDQWAGKPSNEDRVSGT